MLGHICGLSGPARSNLRREINLVLRTLIYFAIARFLKVLVDSPHSVKTWNNQPYNFKEIQFVPILGSHFDLQEGNCQYLMSSQINFFDIHRDFFLRVVYLFPPLRSPRYNLKFAGSGELQLFLTLLQLP